MNFQGTQYELGDKVKVTCFDTSDCEFKVLYGWVAACSSKEAVAVRTVNAGVMKTNKEDMDYIGLI